MKCSWFFCRLTVTVCCWALAGLAMPTAANAAPHKQPFQCPGIQAPCPGDDLTFQRSMLFHVVPSNVMWNNSPPTKTELQSAVIAITNWANARAADGTMDIITNKLKAMGETAFLNAGTDPGDAQSVAAAFGSQITLAAIESYMGSSQLADKQAAWNTINSSGVYGVVINYANALDALANKFQGGKFHMPSKVSAVAAPLIGNAYSMATNYYATDLDRRSPITRISQR